MSDLDVEIWICKDDKMVADSDQDALVHDFDLAVAVRLVKSHVNDVADVQKGAVEHYLHLHRRVVVEGEVGEDEEGAPHEEDH